MGRSYRTYLAGETVYVCRSCGNHLAVQESVMSRVSVVQEWEVGWTELLNSRCESYRSVGAPPGA
jgi:hypothetical protein